MKFLRQIMKMWLPLAAGLTILAGTLYVAVQQSIRLGANMPQAQMAEDAARALANHQVMESVLPALKVDIAESKAPYLIVYDAQGEAVASNGVLRDFVPAPPKGVFDYARAKGENRVTWQPERGLRIAAVVVPISGGEGGFVLAGRSLRESEKTISTVTQLTGLGWAAAMLVSLLLAAFLELMSRAR